MVGTIDGTSDSSNAQTTTTAAQTKTKEEARKKAQKQESPTQKADDVRPPFEGPHYVVAVSKHAAPLPLQYDAQALKAKARGLLKDDRIDSNQRQVLRKILGPEDPPKA